MKSIEARYATLRLRIKLLEGHSGKPKERISTGARAMDAAIDLAEEAVHVSVGRAPSPGAVMRAERVLEELRALRRKEGG